MLKDFDIDMDDSTDSDNRDSDEDEEGLIDQDVPQSLPDEHSRDSKKTRYQSYSTFHGTNLYGMSFRLW